MKTEGRNDSSLRVDFSKQNLIFTLFFLQNNLSSQYPYDNKPYYLIYPVVTRENEFVIWNISSLSTYSHIHANRYLRHLSGNYQRE